MESDFVPEGFDLRVSGFLWSWGSEDIVDSVGGGIYHIGRLRVFFNSDICLWGWEVSQCFCGCWTLDGGCVDFLGF